MATAVQLALLDRIAPQFAGAADREFFVDDEVTQVANIYGARYNRVVCLRAAHRLEMRQRAMKGLMGSGPVSSEGPGLLNYGTSDRADAYWKSTAFGLEYLDIRGSKRVGPTICDGGGAW